MSTHFNRQLDARTPPYDRINLLVSQTARRRSKSAQQDLQRAVLTLT
jgi:hypothetical protein